MKTTITAAALGWALCSFAWAQDAGASETGRQLAKKVAESIITVRVATKMTVTFEGESSNQERKSESQGLVVSANGTTIVPLSNLDPSALFAAMGEEGMSMKTDVTDVKLVRPDGTEIDAKIVLRDKDLDLALLVPTKAPASPLPFVSLAEPGTAEALDPVFVFSRLGRVANRSLYQRVTFIGSVIERPRKRYVVEMGQLSSEVGSPVFDRTGKLLGLITLRAAAGGAADSGDMGGRNSVLPMVVPTADLQKFVSSATAAAK
ncbi:MAG: serine protease [Fimbriimonadales bacterium]